MEKDNDEVSLRLRVAKNCFDALSTIFMYPIHVLDYYNDRFLYMSDTKEFIGGYTPEDIGKNGWRFLLETCVEEEREALKKAVVFMDDFYSRLPVGDKKDYSVSFNYTIKCKGCNRVMRVNHQLVPLLIDDMGRAALFLGAFFPGSNRQGNMLVLRNVKQGKRWVYNKTENCLEHLSEIRLSQMEKLTMLYISSGMTSDMMSQVMNKSVDTINGYRKSVIAKFGVQNIHEAFTMAMIHKLL